MRLLDEERIGGRINRWYRDGDKIGVHTVEDVQPVVDANRRSYNDASDRFGKGTFHRVASIPSVIMEKVCHEKGIPWREFIACKSSRSVRAWNELLNDRDLRAFRTRPGNVVVKAK